MAAFPISCRWITLILMVAGAISFYLYYKVFAKKSLSLIWKDFEHRLFLLTLCVGASIFVLLSLYQTDVEWLDALFSWVSALTTCGLQSTGISNFNPATKMLMILAMCVGGCAGSTVGGFKQSRLYDLLSGVSQRFRAIEEQNGNKKAETKEIPKEVKRLHRLYRSSTLFTMWMLTLTFGWLLLMVFIPNIRGLDALFESASALSSVGLTSGITGPELNNYAKTTLIFMMWLGRLELIPVFYLFLSPFLNNHD